MPWSSGFGEGGRGSFQGMHSSKLTPLLVPSWIIALSPCAILCLEARKWEENWAHHRSLFTPDLSRRRQMTNDPWKRGEIHRLTHVTRTREPCTVESHAVTTSIEMKPSLEVPRWVSLVLWAAQADPPATNCPTVLSAVQYSCIVLYCTASKSQKQRKIQELLVLSSETDPMCPSKPDFILRATLQ